MFEKQKREREERRRAAEQTATDQQLSELEERLDTVRHFVGVRSGEGPDVPIVLKRDEHMLASLQGASLIEPRRSGGQWEGRSQGVSVHVPGTRSMRYRVGASKGHFVQGEEVPTPIDSGTFTITDRRAVFAGVKQTREWSWSKVISVTHASDLPWTAISVSNRQKTSGVLYDREHADLVRFWLDLGIARGTDGTEELANDLEQAIQRIRSISAGSADSNSQTIDPPSPVAQPSAPTETAALVEQPDAGSSFPFVEGIDVVEIVGESHYQETLERLCGGRSEEGHEIATVADLVAVPTNPYDENAVEVRIGGELVGFLARELAGIVSPRLAARTPGGISVRAWIVGGWDRGPGDEGMFGATVLLPKPDSLQP